MVEIRHDGTFTLLGQHRCHPHLTADPHGPWPLPLRTAIAGTQHAADPHNQPHAVIQTNPVVRSAASHHSSGVGGHELLLVVGHTVGGTVGGHCCCHCIGEVRGTDAHHWVVGVLLLHRQQGLVELQGQAGSKKGGSAHTRQSLK